MSYMMLSRPDVERAILDVFCSLEQDVVSEHTFRHLLWDVIVQQNETYTILLKLWEEHGYIRMITMPGKARYIELGPAFERTYWGFI